MPEPFRAICRNCGRTSDQHPHSCCYVRWLTTGEMLVITALVSSVVWGLLIWWVVR